MLCLVTLPVSLQTCHPLTWVLQSRKLLVPPSKDSPSVAPQAPTDRCFDAIEPLTFFFFAAAACCWSPSVWVTPVTNHACRCSIEDSLQSGYGVGWWWNSMALGSIPTAMFVFRTHHTWSSFGLRLAFSLWYNSSFVLVGQSTSDSNHCNLFASPRTLDPCTLGW